MGLRLQDLPVYIMIGAVIIFFLYVIIQSWKPEEAEQSKEAKKKWKSLSG